MHDTASDIGGRFLRRHSQAGHLIVELGAADINGSIRSFAHPEACYVGIDTAPGPGVDLVANGLCRSDCVRRTSSSPPRFSSMTVSSGTPSQICCGS
jgi:hypothetical protein